MKRSRPRVTATLYVLLPVTHETGSVDWGKEAPRYRALALEQMKKIGLQDVEQRIVTEKMVTPTGWAERVRSLQGRDLLDGALARPDAASAAAQSL